MDRLGIEQELRAMTKKELLVLASEAGIVNRYRMNKNSLVEALVLSRIYQSLPESLGIIHGLGRKDLMQLCELAGKKVRRNSRKADLIHALEERVSSMQVGTEVKSVVVAGPDPGDVGQSFLRGEAGASGPLAELSGSSQSYAETRVVLLPVHPYLVHVYWEITNHDLEKGRSRFGRERSRLQPVLRFFDVSMTLPDSAPNHDFFDVKIELDAGQWYVDLWSPHRSYYVELGLTNGRGRFLPLCRSKVVETPRAWPSTEEDERYVRLNHDGELIEVEVLEERWSQDLQLDVAERPRLEGVSEQGWIFDPGPGIHHLAVAQDEAERPEEPCGAQENEKSSAWEARSHFPNTATAIPGTSRPDLTDLCERIAGLGMSSGSRLYAQEDDTSDLCFRR